MRILLLVFWIIFLVSGVLNLAAGWIGPGIVQSAIGAGLFMWWRSRRRKQAQ